MRHQFEWEVKAHIDAQTKKLFELLAAPRKRAVALRGERLGVGAEDVTRWAKRAEEFRKRMEAANAQAAKMQKEMERLAGKSDEVAKAQRKILEEEMAAARASAEHWRRRMKQARDVTRMYEQQYRLVQQQRREEARLQRAQARRAAEEQKAQAQRMRQIEQQARAEARWRRQQMRYAQMWERHAERVRRQEERAERERLRRQRETARAAVYVRPLAGAVLGERLTARAEAAYQGRISLLRHLYGRARADREGAAYWMRQAAAVRGSLWRYRGAIAIGRGVTAAQELLGIGPSAAAYAAAQRALADVTKRRVAWEKTLTQAQREGNREQMRAAAATVRFYRARERVLRQIVRETRALRNARTLWGHMSRAWMWATRQLLRVNNVFGRTIAIWNTLTLPMQRFYWTLTSIFYMINNLVRPIRQLEYALWNLARRMMGEVRRGFAALINEIAELQEKSMQLYAMYGARGLGMFGQALRFTIGRPYTTQEIMGAYRMIYAQNLQRLMAPEQIISMAAPLAAVYRDKLQGGVESVVYGIGRAVHGDWRILRRLGITRQGVEERYGIKTRGLKTEEERNKLLQAILTEIKLRFGGVEKMMSNTWNQVLRDFSDIKTLFAWVYGHTPGNVFGMLLGALTKIRDVLLTWSKEGWFAYFAQKLSELTVWLQPLLDWVAGHMDELRTIAAAILDWVKSGINALLKAFTGFDMEDIKRLQAEYIKRGLPKQLANQMIANQILQSLLDKIYEWAPRVLELLGAMLKLQRAAVAVALFVAKAVAGLVDFFTHQKPGTTARTKTMGQTLGDWAAYAEQAFTAAQQFLEAWKKQFEASPYAGPRGHTYSPAQRIKGLMPPRPYYDPNTKQTYWYYYDANGRVRWYPHPPKMRHYQSGGYVEQTGPAVVHRGEMVLPADKVKKLWNLLTAADAWGHFSRVFRAGGGLVSAFAPMVGLPAYGLGLVGSAASWWRGRQAAHYAKSTGLEAVMRYYSRGAALMNMRAPWYKKRGFWTALSLLGDFFATRGGLLLGGSLLRGGTLAERLLAWGGQGEHIYTTIRDVATGEEILAAIPRTAPAWLRGLRWAARGAGAALGRMGGLGGAMQWAGRFMMPSWKSWLSQWQWLKLLGYTAVRTNAPTRLYEWWTDLQRRRAALREYMQKPLAPTSNRYGAAPIINVGPIYVSADVATNPEQVRKIWLAIVSQSRMQAAARV